MGRDWTGEVAIILKWHDGREPYKKTCRWIMAILVLVLVYAVMQAFIPRILANNEQVYIEHVVEPGETIYSISRMYRDDQDWRKTAYEIQQASDCTALIRPGQVLLVPVR